MVPSPPSAPHSDGKLPPKASPCWNSGRGPPVMFCSTDTNLAPVAVGTLGKVVNRVLVTSVLMSAQLAVGYLGSPARACAVTCTAANWLNSSASPITPHIGTAPW